ncbi:hypothetical protein BDV12DRAFT_160282 [Aspergillus spectabilis]
MAVINEIITTFSMTALFTPPAPCETSWTYEPEGANNVRGGLIIQNAATFAPSCFPSDFNQVGRIQASHVYHPGYCPVGYTSADVAVDGDVTTAICCLSDFHYYTSTLSYGDGGEDVFAGCTSLFPSRRSTIIPVRQETTATQVIGPVTMWAQPITIALESSDSSLFISPTTSSTSSVASETSTTTTTTTEPESTLRTTSETNLNSDSAAETSTPTSADSSPEGGLSTSAAIGLGVGVGVGGLAAFAAVGIWFWRSRKAKKERAALALNAPYNGQRVPYYQELTKPRPWQATVEEMDGSSNRHRGAPFELHG